VVDSKELVRRYQWLGVSAVVVLAVLIGVAVVVGFVVAGTDLVTAPSYGTERQARDELDRIETPIGASVTGTFSRANSGLPIAHRTYETAADCFAEETGLVGAIEAAGFQPREIDDPLRLRWERDIEGRLTAYIDLTSLTDVARPTCELVAGFYEDR
jgi:hypothetical protein